LAVVVGAGLAVVGRFTVTRHHEGAPGLIHGGILAAAFDEVLGALNWLLLTPAVTGRLETDFRCPVPVGADVEIEASVDSVQGRKVWCSGTARLPDGTTAAEARGLFIQVPLEHFRRHAGRSQPEVPGGTLELAP
jgi:acyl-coenzyme A thioesterase PaaI-like protein